MVLKKTNKRQLNNSLKNKEPSKRFSVNPNTRKKFIERYDVLDNESIHSEEFGSDTDAAHLNENRVNENYHFELEETNADSEQINRVKVAERYIKQLGYGSKPDEEVEKELDSQETSAGDKSVSTTFYSEVYLKPDSSFYKGHKGGVTTVTLPEFEPSKAFTGSKDCSIISWDLNTGAKTIFAGRRNQPKLLGGHFAQCLDVCCSASGNMVISAGLDQIIRIWDPRVSTSNCIRELTGHQGSITGVCIDPSSVSSYNDCVFYSTSTDKSLKQWSLAMQESMETFYGHTASPCTMDILKKQRPLTGGEDNSLRYWKIETGTHLLYGNQRQNVDSVGQLDELWLLSGSQDASISLWSLKSRKPLCTLYEPHGADGWITSLGCIKNSNVFFSGSNDGMIRCWQVTTRKDPRIVPLSNANIPVNGFVTRIALSHRNNFCVAAVSNEHRLGRWEHVRNAKNGICLFRYFPSE